MTQNNEYFKGKPVYLHNLFSGENSFVVPLLGNGIHSGTWEDCTHYDVVKLSCFTDQVGKITIDFSMDQENIDYSITNTVYANKFYELSENTKRKYYRITYVNGSVAQTFFRLQTILTNQPSNLTLNPNDRNEIGFKNVLTDSFGRLRVSQPYGVFEGKFLFDKKYADFEDVLYGSGAASYNTNDSSVDLTVGTALGDYAIRQTYRYFNYIPGKGHLVLCTGNFKGAESNRVKRIGYYDNYSGVFFEVTSSGLFAVVRSKTTGLVVDDRVAQADFNIDKLDGSGPSGVTIDLNKSQIMVISFQWLGVGTVTVGFDFNGELYPAHQFHHANFIDATYMQNPTLPVRYELANTGTASGTGSLKQICTSVTSEGGYQVPGQQFSACHNTTSRAITDVSLVPVFAIRLKTSLAGKENRASARLLNFSSFAQSANILIQLVHCTGVTASTATWTSVNANSAVEYSTDISAITATHSAVVDTVYAPSGQANFGTQSTTNFDTINSHLILAQNYASTSSQYLVIYAKSLSGNASISSAVTWLEIQ